MDFVALLLGLLIGGIVVGVLMWLAAKKQASNVATERQHMQAANDQLKERGAQIEKELSRLEERASRIDQLESQVSQLTEALGHRDLKLSELREIHARLETEKAGLEQAKQEQLQLIEKAELRLKESFQALSGEVLKSSSENFLNLAANTLKAQQEKAVDDVSAVVKPLRERLGEMQESVKEIEKARGEAYGAITKQIEQMVGGTSALQMETQKLISALKMPAQRGQWGEVQLRNVVEMSGMMQYVNFESQVSTETEKGARRPDMVVRMPGNREIVIDAKAVLDAYLAAMETTDEDLRKIHLKRHAEQVKIQITELSQKKYHDQFERAPDFVVLFLPIETLYHSALEQDPNLMQYAASKGIVIATPTTLIALLKAISYGWRQLHLEADVKKIAALGKELYDRMTTVASHVNRMGKNLNDTVNNYNSMIVSMETRMMVTARKFRDLDGFDQVPELPDLKHVDQLPQPTKAPELAVAQLPYDDEPEDSNSKWQESATAE